MSDLGTPAPGRALRDGEILAGRRVGVRLVTLADCTPRYVEWLRDPEVHRFLETRWTEQTVDSVRAFVQGVIASGDTYLLAIVERVSGEHVGNLKIGPVHRYHRYADVSYFIGERSRWGRGYASEAIALAAVIGFDRLGLHRLQAGIYASNRASGRALERVGFQREGVFRRKLALDGDWDDHVVYGLLREEWTDTEWEALRER